jgi:hypothetical protein
MVEMKQQNITKAKERSSKWIGARIAVLFCFCFCFHARLEARRYICLWPLVLFGFLSRFAKLYNGGRVFSTINTDCHRSLANARMPAASLFVFLRLAAGIDSLIACSIPSPYLSSLLPNLSSGGARARMHVHIRACT